MPPLSRSSQAIRKADTHLTGKESSVVYTGNVDSDWVVGSVPNGGYILSLILESCIQHQAGSEHPDPLHASTHFIQASGLSAFEIHIRILKRGKTFVNIQAELVQGGRLRVTTQLIFSKIPPSTGPVADITSGYTRRLPLLQHPAESAAEEIDDMFPIFKLAKHIHWAEDSDILKQNDEASSVRETVITGFWVWGAWIELKDPGERLTPASLGVFADCFRSIATLFPPSITGIKTANMWTPTLALNLEYKAPIPPPSTLYSPRTVGVYVVSGYLSAPQGRHDTFIEIWTAPSEIGSGKVVDGWRDQQICLAVASQVQLISSGDVNAKVAAEGAKL